MAEWSKYFTSMLYGETRGDLRSSDHGKKHGKSWDSFFREVLVPSGQLDGAASFSQNCVIHDMSRHSFLLIRADPSGTPQTHCEKE